MSETNYKPGTLCLHAGQEPDPATNSRAVPIYQTTSYVFNDTDHAARLFGLQEFGNIYTPDHESDLRCAREAIALPRRGKRGAGGRVRAGGRIAGDLSTSPRRVRTSSRFEPVCTAGRTTCFITRFRSWASSCKFVDQSDPENFRKAIDDNTRCIFLETIGNPRCDIPDFEAIAAIAHEAGIPVIVDNTLASPYLCRPFDHGCRCRHSLLHEVHRRSRHVDRRHHHREGGLPLGQRQVPRTDRAGPVVSRDEVLRDVRRHEHRLHPQGPHATAA